ncbi:MAG: nuclear transport factor 2 family protein [Sphingomonadales bacterium]|nr:MAG: nuclear transport factor 2 family protein [Sphingomonadales bacterium]
MLAVSLIGAQSPPVPIPGEERVRMADDAFWAAFNACDRARMAASLAPDIEFYHDKTGATVSRDAVVKSLMDGPCGTKGLRVRRELVAGSLSYNEVPGFGAILTGRHRFYAQRDGEPERLDGEARFAVVWRDVKGRLLMRRVLSYAHGVAIEQTALPMVDVPLATMQRFVGHYTSPMGDIAVTLHESRLHLVSGGLSVDLVAINATTFQAQGRPLRIEFIDTGGRVETMLVQEGGTTVAKGTRQDAL